MAKEYPLDSKAVHPKLSDPLYKASEIYSPAEPLVEILPTLSELSGPTFGTDLVSKYEFDLTTQHEGHPVGERIVVFGRVLDEDGKGIPNALIEIWQANAGGRYIHKADESPVPLDPNFDGAGSVLTNENGEYKFITIKPGAYAFIGQLSVFWRSRHIHVSVLGPAYATRLVTQMYFPGDPLQAQDRIFLAVRDEQARSRMISSLDLEQSDMHSGTLAYQFNLVLRGREMTPFEES